MRHDRRSAIILAFLTTAATVLAMGVSAVPGSALIAGVYGLAGDASTVAPGFEYAHAGALFDVSQGNNDWFNRGRGASCGFDYLCVAKKGYDAPTGLGTPDGTAF